MHSDLRAIRAMGTDNLHMKTPIMTGRMNAVDGNVDSPLLAGGKRIVQGMNVLSAYANKP
jgi:hypothetical protein